MLLCYSCLVLLINFTYLVQWTITGQGAAILSSLSGLTILLSYGFKAGFCALIGVPVTVLLN